MERIYCFVSTSINFATALEAIKSRHFRKRSFEKPAEKPLTTRSGGIADHTDALIVRNWEFFDSDL
jgi:hypothetical protein